MKTNISVITLGVADLNRSLAFYRDGMGLPTKGIEGTEFEDGAVVFFHMNQNLMLALYPKAALAKDARVSVSPPSASEFSIGHNVGSKQEVDKIMQQAKQAGATITNPAHDRFWGGYSGYLRSRWSSVGGRLGSPASPNGHTILILICDKQGQPTMEIKSLISRGH